MAWNEVALVSGAGSGTGAATTARLRQKGIPVVGMGRRASPDVLPVDLGAAPFEWVQGDQGESAAWDRAVAIARDRFGMAPSILVVSGARLEVGTVLTLTEEEWIGTFNTNVFGVVRGLRAVLPAMIARGKGSIVTVGSIDSLFAEQGLVSYAASKGALLQLTRTVAMDHARDGIRANTVIMGVTDTPFFRRHLDTASDPERFVAIRENRQPMGHLLSADEVAAMVVFLALDDASGVTGAAIAVDGGITTSFDFRTGAEGA
jgi:NAD(P)-dependent dehydrogenase (short-subunit alcohol dehydrogenase family)